MDSVKQSAALCLLRLNRTSPDLVAMGEWTTRVVHLLNDQHLVRTAMGPGVIMRGLWTFGFSQGDLDRWGVEERILSPCLSVFIVRAMFELN